jgi:hypothetical protein
MPEFVVLLGINVVVASVVDDINIDVEEVCVAGVVVDVGVSETILIHADVRIKTVITTITINVRKKLSILLCIYYLLS